MCGLKFEERLTLRAAPLSYTPRLPTFRLRTLGHPHLRCYTLLCLHKAMVYNAFTTHPDSTQPIHHIPVLHSSFVHLSSVDATRTSISRG